MLTIFIYTVFSIFGIFSIRRHWKNRIKLAHEKKPILTTEPVITSELISKLTNSNYAKDLNSLNIHVAGRTVVQSIVGNAGFILYLENNSRASAYRKSNEVNFEFGSGACPPEAITKTNSAGFGDASEYSIDKQPYANSANNIKKEVEKSHGRLITGLAIGGNRFNFAFENGMELEFFLCNDKNNKPSIRVFWEQW